MHRLGRALVVGVVGLAAAAWGLPLASQARPASPLVARGERVGGYSYLQWQVAAWQWLLARITIPRAVPDPAPCVIDGQVAPVWFLAADFDRRDAVVGTCAVPAGSYIMVPSPSIDCSTVEPRPLHARSDAGLRRCARAAWRAARTRHTVTLDGVGLRPPGYVVATPAFVFAMPGNENYLGVPGATVGRAATFGYADMLRPLASGRHTLVRVSQYRGGARRRTTWHLVVG